MPGASVAVIEEGLPDLVIDNPWADSDPVRVVHLLEHTAGFNDIAFRHYLIEGSDLTVADAVRLYAPYQSRWRPGTRTAYSNAGPVIAGRIVEVVSGQRFERYMAENVIGPLQMRTARWTKTPAVAKALSKSYFYDGTKEEPFVEIAGRPSGSLNMTAADLALLPMLMLARGTLDGETIIGPQTATRIERPRLRMRRGWGSRLAVRWAAISTLKAKRSSLDMIARSMDLTLPRVIRRVYADTKLLKGVCLFRAAAPLWRSPNGRCRLITDRAQMGTFAS